MRRLGFVPRDEAGLLLLAAFERPLIGLLVVWMIPFVLQLEEAEQNCGHCSGRRPFGKSWMT